MISGIQCSVSGMTNPKGRLIKLKNIAVTYMSRRLHRDNLF